MTKYLYLCVLLSAVFVVSGCTDNSNKITGSEVSNDCASLCAQANSKCAEFASGEECRSQCVNWDQATKDKIKTASDCSGMLAKPKDRMTELIPEINEPNLPVAKNDCEAACNKYVMNCLTLVPNVSETVFNDGYNYCLGECAKWDKKKIDCMIATNDCPSMSEVCGL
ncbi:MAG: hypothetical protein WC473_02240 [Patescibacteria group bacterium]